MKKSILLVLILILNFNFLISNSFAQTPAKPQTKAILFLNGTAHIGNGKIIEHSAIGFKDGKLNLVALNSSEIDRSEYAEILDATGKHIYPGFIIPNSIIGLEEIGAVRATSDFNEVGYINPNIRSIIAYNTDSKVTPTIRTNGILLAQIVPQNGLITGTSSIVELDGWNWEDAVYKLDDGIHVNFPRMFLNTGNVEEKEQSERMKQNEKQLNELNTFFKDAKAYFEIKNPTTKNLKMEAMKGLFDGSKTLYIRANYVKELIEAINFSKSFDIKKLIIVGAADSWKITDVLKENNVSVILNQPHDLPNKIDDDIDLPYKLPYLLSKSGVMYCLGQEGIMNIRNLPFNAGTTAAYGLDKEQALMSITLNTAKILGIDKTVGSIEVGKDATFFISNGDALDMRTNKIEIAFIRGKNIDLNNQQKELYNKHKTKFE